MNTNSMQYSMLSSNTPIVCANLTFSITVIPHTNLWSDEKHMLVLSLNKIPTILLDSLYPNPAMLGNLAQFFTTTGLTFLTGLTGS